MQLAIMNYENGSIELHTLPQHVANGTTEELQDYLYLTLDFSHFSSHYMTGESITVRDYRNHTHTFEAQIAPDENGNTVEICSYGDCPATRPITN